MARCLVIARCAAKSHAKNARCGTAMTANSTGTGFGMMTPHSSRRSPGKKLGRITDVRRRRARGRSALRRVPKRGCRKGRGRAGRPPHGTPAGNGRCVPRQSVKALWLRRLRLERARELQARPGREGGRLRLSARRPRHRYRRAQGRAGARLVWAMVFLRTRYSDRVCRSIRAASLLQDP